MEYQSILQFWFGSFSSPSETIKQQSALWWAKNLQVDKEIKGRFEQDLQSLLAGELDHWKQFPQGWLAMIILADQFSRNMYRDDARAFAQDELALALCLEGIDCGVDLQLDLLQRVFFYLPLEHAESMDMQRRSVARQKQLMDTAPDELKDSFRGFYNYAVSHFEVIEKFGRYPHRNAILGRNSNAEELAYLARPGSGF